MQELEEWKVTEEEKIVDQKQKNIAEKVMRDEQLALQKASLKEEA